MAIVSSLLKLTALSIVRTRGNQNISGSLVAKEI